MEIKLSTEAARELRDRGRTVLEGTLLLSVEEAARELRVTGRTVQNLVTKEGELKYTRIGRRRLIARDALVRYIKQNTK